MSQISHTSTAVALDSSNRASRGSLSPQDTQVASSRVSGKIQKEKAQFSVSEGPSRALSPPPVPDSDLPDGDWEGWLQVLGSFLLNFNCWGFFNTYGAFQTFYEEDFLSASGASAISWIGSVEGLLLLAGGAFAGPIFDMGYYRLLEAVGSFLIVFGIMMTSISTKYYQVFLAHGVVVGLGCGCMYVPTVANVVTYFRKKRSFAAGVTSVGSPLGGVIYPIIFHKLQPRIGFAWTMRVMGFIALGTSLVALAIIRQRAPSAVRRKLVDWAAFREPPYTLFTLGNTLGFMGSYVPYFFVTAYATSHTSATKDLAFYFLVVLNAASVPGRLLPTFLADRTGPLNATVPAVGLCAILAFCWLAVDTVGGLATFCVLYGCALGTFVSMAPSTVASLTPDIARVGTRMGVTLACGGVGTLIGTPIAGSLINAATGDYRRAILFGAFVMLATCVCLVLARVAKVGWRPVKA